MVVVSFFELSGTRIFLSPGKLRAAQWTRAVLIQADIFIAPRPDMAFYWSSSGFIIIIIILPLYIIIISRSKYPRP